MIESNLVNLKQSIGLLGASKKLQKGNTGLPVRRQTGKEHGQMMPFLCMMGQICRITTQETEKTNQSLNNILGAGKDKTEKTNQSLPVKGKGIAESSHGAILKGEVMKDINPFMNASKGKGTKTNRSFSGKINLQSESGGQKQIGVEVKNLLEGSVLKESKAGRTHPQIVATPGQLKPGLNKSGIEAGLQKSGLTGVVAGKDEAVKESRSLRAADTVGQNFRTGKNIAALFKDGKNDTAFFKDGKNDVAVFKDGGLKKSRSGSDFRATKDAPELLKFNLKNAVTVKGKSAVEQDSTGKNSFTLVKSGGKNDIGNPPKHLGLKGEEVAAWHKKTGVKEFPDHKMGILHRGISPPERPSDRDFSAGAYHHTSFHSGGSSSAINESVNSYVIEPRALIKQIASGVKRPGRVRITLHPPRLGTLDVDVLVRDNKVHVILQTENNDVRQILQSNVESLKSSLRNHGLVADTINVSVQEKSDGASHGADYRSGQSETLFKEGGNRKGNEEDQGREQNSLNHNPSSFEEENPRVRSDGRISLFV